MTDAGAVAGRDADLQPLADGSSPASDGSQLPVLPAGGVLVAWTALITTVALTRLTRCMTQSDDNTHPHSASTEQPTGDSATRRILEIVVSWASRSPKAAMILSSHPNQNDLRRKATL